MASAPTFREADFSSFFPVRQIMDPNSRRLHPLVATAAVSLILLSVVGVAALTGWLPRSASAPSVETAPLADATPVKPEPAPAAPAVEPAPASKPHKAAPVHHAAAHAQMAQAAPSASTEPVAEPAPAAPAVPACGNCGVVEFVQAHDKPGSQGSGLLGTVIGGVAGGLLGNQVGSGRGKKLATLAGAVGGAMAGRRVEQSRQQQAVYYEIGVRFEDGRLQTFTQDAAPSVSTGQRVRVTAGTVFPQ
jgi:uncharacterized protein YcfJ